MLKVRPPTLEQKNGQNNIRRQRTKNPAAGLPLVRFETFIQAIGDSGYKGTASAIAELVDNAIEARANTIAVELACDGDTDEISTIRVSDDAHAIVGTRFYRKSFRAAY